MAVPPSAAARRTPTCGNAVVVGVSNAWRLHALVSSVPVALWTGVHLWEQWAAFGGRARWLNRMGATTGGVLGPALELLLGILPLLLWFTLEVRLRPAGEPEALRWAYGEGASQRIRMGRLATVAGWVLLAFLAYHAAWLWVPRVLGGAEPAVAWAQLETSLGSWAHATAHAVGITALAVHLAFAPARVLVAYDLLGDAEGRRAARLSGAVVAVLLFVLYGQLAGWHATGAGTFWSVAP
jgi:hypothetical protein